MLADASLALSELASPPFRRVLAKSVGLTLLLLVLVWIAIEGVIVRLIDFGDYAWLGTAAAWLAGLGMVIGLAFLIAPITSLTAGFFADEIAEAVEKRHYPDDAPGKALPFVPALTSAVRFTLLVIAANILMLLLLLVPGVNLVIFFLGNGYLLGREYFETVAMRYQPPPGAKALRRRHAMQVFLAGLLIAVFLAIPILNLATPLFATAFMVHVQKRLAAANGLGPAAAI